MVNATNNEAKLAQSGSYTGLTQAQAWERLAQDGYNELNTNQSKGVMALVLEIAQEPMILLLLGGAIVYWFLGEPTDAVIMMGSVVFVVAIAYYQEQKTEHALEALRDLSSPRAMVIRDGQPKRIPGREVVCQDVVLLAEGDRVPADGGLLSNWGLTVDESLLTGESVPVHKTLWDGHAPLTHPGQQESEVLSPFVYSGSLITQGHGIMQVLATGTQTQMGRIGQSLEGVTVEKTPIQQETNRLVKVFASLGLVLCLGVVIIEGVLHQQWLEGLLSGITMAMALLPEEFPIVFTVFIALGAWRLSKHHVLARRAQAVEALGAATVLCVDKTGTLTENRMVVASLLSWSEDRQHLEVLTVDEGTIPDGGDPCHIQSLITVAQWASKPQTSDPMEQAIQQCAQHAGQEVPYAERTLIKAYPLTDKERAITHIWEDTRGGRQVMSKGAMEFILPRCPALTKDQRQWIESQVMSVAAQGIRLLAVAQIENYHGELPEQQRDFSWTFLGLIGFKDPVRPHVKEAMAACAQAGIRVVMMTGDYPATAQAIAQEVGLTDRDQLAADDHVMTGQGFASLDEAAQEEAVRQAHIFSRMIPEQKLQLVERLKAQGEVVVMTGDGVNDAPALKAAHIGIAMGKRGTDVAREAAALVLVDDDFTSIVRGIRLGRRIFDNLRKALAYVVAVHMPIAGMSVIPVLLNLPMILLPVHVVFMEFVIDPACSMVFEAEPEEPNVMHRPPRPLTDAVINRRILIQCLIQGVVALGLALGIYLGALALDHSYADARTLTFAVLMMGNLAMIAANRSASQSVWTTLMHANPAMWWVVGSSLTALILCIYTPWLRSLFHFTVLHPADLLVCGGAALLMMILFDAVKGWAARDVTIQPN